MCSVKPRPPLAEIPAHFRQRFWSYVRLGPSCWEWVGAACGKRKRSRGKGQFNFRTVDGRRMMVMSGQFAWLLHHGEWPTEHVIRMCGNTLCVNPAHMTLGCEALAVFYQRKSGRWPHGENHPRAKLSAAQVRQIREQKGKVLQKDLAAEYGITKTTVSNIMLGKRWKEAS